MLNLHHTINVGAFVCTRIATLLNDLKLRTQKQPFWWFSHISCFPMLVINEESKILFISEEALNWSDVNHLRTKSSYIQIFKHEIKRKNLNFLNNYLPQCDDKIILKAKIYGNISHNDHLLLVKINSIMWFLAKETQTFHIFIFREKYSFLDYNLV